VHADRQHIHQATGENSHGRAEGNVLLAGLLVRSITNQFWPPILAALLSASSPILVDWHIIAMTEPLFLFLGSIGLYLLNQFSREASEP